MPNLPNNWKTDLYPFVGKRFDFELSQLYKDNKFLALFDKVTTASAHYDLQGGGDMAELPDYVDGSINVMNPKRGFNTTVSPKEGMGVYHIHYKQWLNDMSGEYKKAGSQLASACYVREKNTVLRLINRAFDSAYTGGDGKAWAATDHPNGSKGTESGSRTFEADASTGTYSNLFSGALSVASIDAMRNAALTFETPSGNIYEGYHNLCLVSPQNAAKAAKLFGMERQLRPTKDPESAENAANSTYDIMYMVVGGGSETNGLGLKGKQFALVDQKNFMKTNAIVYNSKPESGSMINVNPKIKSFYSYVDCAAGWGDARNILFSTGV